MSEIKDIPIPLASYANLIREKRSPYYEIVEFLMKDMEMHFCKDGQAAGTVYAINPRALQKEIEKKVKDEKLTSVNVCRTLLAMLKCANLDEEKDYFVTTTSSGRRNYHINMNKRTMNSIGSLL